MTAPAESALTVVEIVRADYASLSSIIARIEGYRDVLRGATLTLWTAAMGLGVANHNGLAPLGATVLVPLLAWADLRFDYQYGVAHRRSRELEEIVQAYVTRVLESDRPLEDDAQEQLDDLLAQYSFGSNLNIIGPSARKVLAKENRNVGWPTVLYSVLFFVLAVASKVV
ncbi:MAG: hypothetical protein QOF60_3218 [Actinomycetota bacterium]|nr:hypothetical protein [Actinomycetota bacterium]